MVLQSVTQFSSGKEWLFSHFLCVVLNAQQQKGEESLSWPNIYCKCPCVMEADGTSWPDYKLAEKPFWNINVAWIYWGSVALHVSLMASPSCCLPDCEPLKWTDLEHTVFARLSGVFVWWSFCLCRLTRYCQSAIHFWLAAWLQTALQYNVHRDFLSLYYELSPLDNCLSGWLTGLLSVH